jgi:hypothetical protein
MEVCPDSCFLEYCSEEIILHVFSFLGLRDKVALTMVSHTCKRLSLDYSLELVFVDRVSLSQLSVKAFLKKPC